MFCLAATSQHEAAGLVNDWVPWGLKMVLWGESLDGRDSRTTDSRSGSRILSEGAKLSLHLTHMNTSSKSIVCAVHKTSTNLTHTNTNKILFFLENVLTRFYCLTLPHSYCYAQAERGSKSSKSSKSVSSSVPETMKKKKRNPLNGSLNCGRV